MLHLFHIEKDHNSALSFYVYTHTMHDTGFPLETIRHSVSHLLAQAVQRCIDPHAQLGTGPAIDTGFYYDILFSDDVEFGEKDLKQLTKQIKMITKEPQSYVRFDCTLQDGYGINKLTKQNFKDALLDKFAEAGESHVSYFLNIVPKAVLENMRNTSDAYKNMYANVTTFFQENGTITSDQAVVFLDLCAGPHISITKEDIDPAGIKLDRIAGAYRQADENNPMMTRIYGLCFADKETLQTHETMMEEARKRDHRVLGKQLGLYTINPESVGSGLILWKPKGAFIVHTIKRWFEDEQLKAGYIPVITPHIGKKTLWETSGHRGFYNDGMFPPLELGQTLEDRQDKRTPKESETYLLKPMNCPLHVEIYNDDPHSYRELPLRYYEFGTVYRYEQKGELGGLTRVRGFTQDDAHIIVDKENLKAEFGRVVDFALNVLHTFHFQDVNIYASFRDKENKEKYLGPDDMRDTAEDTIKDILEEKNISFQSEEGEAAFYGPKIDFKVKDVIGREWQLSTVQFDFNLPERFNMTFTNTAGEEEQPFMIHRALLGSLERFMGVVIENYAGAFPVWLSATQVIILPVADAFNTYGNTVYDTLHAQGLRAILDDSTDSLNKKIRNAEKEKIPYILVIGEKEQTEQSVSVREYRSKEQYTLSLDAFGKKIIQDIENKTL